MNNEKKTGEETKRGEAAHDQNQRHPNWGDDKRQANPQHEEQRSANRKESREKFEEHNAQSAGKNSDSTHPDHKEDTQSSLSEDPTRKNEANQGASDLRKRERTSFRREGETEE